LITATEHENESPDTRSLFFVLSGEHDSLPAAEVEAILDSVGLRFDVVRKSYRLLLLHAAREALRVVSQRSLMYDSCGTILGECAADEREVVGLVKALPLEDLTKNSETFSVRSARLGGVNKTLGRANLEREIGSLVKLHVPRLKVSLSNPDLTLACVIFEGSVLIGLSGFSKASGLIAPRRPRKRPVFHPSTMPPKIARCMVNLARARPSTVFADPFSGVGGIVIEAAVIGCNVVGIDASLRMIRGARRNTRHFGLETLGLLKADARNIPLRDVDAIATDPPYGRGSSTMGTKVTTLFSDFLAGAGESLKGKSCLCVSAPVEIHVEDYARDAGLACKERHLAKVHRSLTRQFVVLQNTHAGH
jgi:tRNA (guanine10-N2)-dimethyltransferase